MWRGARVVAATHKYSHQLNMVRLRMKMNIIRNETRVRNQVKKKKIKVGQKQMPKTSTSIAATEFSHFKIVLQKWQSKEKKNYQSP